MTSSATARTSPSPLLTKVADFNDSIGAYTFDAQTGEIGEGRILFSETDDLAAGAAATVTVGKGEGLGLFLVPDGAEAS